MLAKTEVEIASFKYATRAISLREWLQNTTEQIHSLAYRTACDAIRIGRLIAEVKSRLKSRTFKNWVETDLPWSRSHAYKMMRAAELFGPLVSHRETERIAPLAMYMLSAHSVPDEARISAVALAATRTVTVSDAREILAAHRRSPEPTKKELRVYERTMAGVFHFGDSGSSQATAPPAELAAIWDAMTSLFGEGATLHIAPLEEDDGELSPLASVTVYAPPERPRNFIRRHLGDAILAAAGREREKLCPSCGHTKPVPLFGDNDKETDGRNRYCRECERARLLKVKHESKRKKASGP